MRRLFVFNVHLVGESAFLSADASGATERHVDVEDDERTVVGKNAPSLIVQVFLPQRPRIGGYDTSLPGVRDDAVETALFDIGAAGPETVVPVHVRTSERFPPRGEQFERNFVLLDAEDVGKSTVEAAEVVREGVGSRSLGRGDVRVGEEAGRGEIGVDFV